MNDLDAFMGKLSDLLQPIVLHAESGGLDFVFLFQHKGEKGVVTMANVATADRERIVEIGLVQAMAASALERSRRTEKN